MGKYSKNTHNICANRKTSEIINFYRANHTISVSVFPIAHQIAYTLLTSWSGWMDGVRVYLQKDCDFVTAHRLPHSSKLHVAATYPSHTAQIHFIYSASKIFARGWTSARKQIYPEPTIRPATDVSPSKASDCDKKRLQNIHNFYYTYFVFWLSSGCYICIYNIYICICIYDLYYSWIQQIYIYKYVKK